MTRTPYDDGCYLPPVREAPPLYAKRVRERTTALLRRKLGSLPPRVDDPPTDQELDRVMAFARVSMYFHESHMAAACGYPVDRVRHILRAVAQNRKVREKVRSRGAGRWKYEIRSID